MVLQRSILAVQVESSVLDVCWWVCGVDSIHHTRKIEAYQGVSNPRRRFPAIISAFEILVKEPLEVVVLRLLIEIMPFLRMVDSKPVRPYQLC